MSSIQLDLSLYHLKSDGVTRKILTRHEQLLIGLEPFAHLYCDICQGFEFILLHFVHAQLVVLEVVVVALRVKNACTLFICNMFAGFGYSYIGLDVLVEVEGRDSQRFDDC